MFEIGFLGTNAPLYMDIVTVYFGLLPLLLGSAIYMAVKKKYDLHYKMQLGIFALTLLVVVIFEIGVRVSGGFNEFMKGSNADYIWMVIFMIIHILIALASVILWALLIYSAVKEYRLNATPFVKSHKKLGKLVYAGMSITSLMGILVYYFLFMY
ncbi:DUF420 domain-containing protein [bacterium]|nr:DUF420 domain-containing protein [bacterium]MBU1990887.1 DUF420 domain-containing protein [bacterium]